MAVIWSRPTKSVVGRYGRLHQRRGAARAARETAAEMPELLTAYAAFARGRQSGASRQPFKGWDLWRLLQLVRPGSIAEMGSGTTSAVFALYARRHGAPYVAYEHSADWAGVTVSCLKEAGLTGPEVEVRTVAMHTDDARRSTGFAEPIPPGVDLIYVDGPPCPTVDGVKWPNDDVVRHLDAGHRPRAIVVDGRLSTVDLIRRHEAGRRYALRPSLQYALRHGSLGDALGLREHTLFLREDA